MDNRAAEAMIFWVLMTMATLVILGLISRGRSPVGLKLVLMGIVLALVALWYGMISGLPNHQGVSLPIGNPALGEVALKLAAVLVLGGIVTGLLTREASSAPPALPERPRDVPPSV